MEVPADQVADLFSVLAGILQLGNLTFVTAGGAQVQDKSCDCFNHFIFPVLIFSSFFLPFLIFALVIFLLSSSHPPLSLHVVLQKAASLLGLDAFRLGDALTQKFMKLRGEEITTPLTIEQVKKKHRGQQQGF